MSLELPPPRSISQSEYDRGLDGRLSVREVVKGSFVQLVHSGLSVFTLNVEDVFTRFESGIEVVGLAVEYDNGQSVVPSREDMLAFAFSTFSNSLMYQSDGAIGYLLNSPNDDFDRSVSAMLDEEAAASRVLIGV